MRRSSRYGASPAAARVRIYPSPGNAPVWREREAACLWSRYAS
nr:MAG TPA: hypothetical protein [Caudoviricetes sp.]